MAKTGYGIRSQRSILAIAGVCVVIYLSKNMGKLRLDRWLQPESEQGSDSQIWKIAGPGLKNFGTGTESKKVTPATSGIYRTCPGEHVLAATRFNVTFLPLRLCYENTRTRFSKDAENLTIWLRDLMQSDCLYSSLFFKHYNRISHYNRILWISGVRGGGRGGRPLAWKIQGKLCFQVKIKLLKNLER